MTSGVEGEVTDPLSVLFSCSLFAGRAFKLIHVKLLFPSAFGTVGSLPFKANAKIAC